jgi:MFS transporter, DHA1 family, multidrug resistance protein
MTSRSALRALVRKEILAICALVFTADIVVGILGATFSLYAAALGASVVFIGLLTSLTGMTSLVASVPVGIVSDRVGRGRVLFGGMASFALAMALFAIAPSPIWLIPGRLLLGVAMVSSFWIAAAYLGDVVTGAERGMAFGLLTTSMGLGFAIGPFLGGEVAERFGIRGAYVLAVVAALVGAVIVLTVLRGHRPRIGRQTAQRPSLRESLRVGRERPLIIAGIANILSAFTFGGAVATIFPLYGNALGLSAGTIGTMFAIRAIVLTIISLPSGALIAAIGSGRVMLGALVVEVIAVAGIGTAQHYGPMLLWLVLEGIGFGAFLTSSQAYVAEHTEEATRGAAIGFYSMTGGIGKALAPIALGVVAASFGLGAAFFATGGFGLLALVTIGAMWFRQPPVAVAPGQIEGNV